MVDPIDGSVDPNLQFKGIGEELDDMIAKLDNRYPKMSVLQSLGVASRHPLSLENKRNDLVAENNLGVMLFSLEDKIQEVVRELERSV